MTSVLSAPERTTARTVTTACLCLVPPVTGVLFWTTKILTTGAGEVASDYLGGSAHAALEVDAAGLRLVAAHGGLGYHAGPVALVLLVAIAVVLVVTEVARRVRPALLVTAPVPGSM